MKNNRTTSVIILTGLPFRKHGNQSLIRFANMFLNRGIKVTMFSAGSDAKGEHAITDLLFSIYKINSIQIASTKLLNKVSSKIQNSQKDSENYFSQVNSEDIIPPYGNYSFSTLLNKWIKFYFHLVDNFSLYVYLYLKHTKKIRKADTIIGYESNYTLCAKLISLTFKKKYINKFQGTILKATNRNRIQALKFFPHNFFSINKSDLCLMVNDGTDGKYYAKSRGCKNIFFEPHGVFSYKHSKNYKNSINKFKKENKFILFNNASTSTWKRTDRIIRSIAQIDPQVLKNIVVITTYHAHNRNDLINFAKSKKLERNILFMDKTDSIESNYILQNSDVAIMTNDFSNLGNPILEAIYYKVPVISIDDGSLDGFLANNVDSILVKLNHSFDKNLALAIEKLYKDRNFYNRLKKNLNRENPVKELSIQQNREFKVIQKLLNKCSN